MISSPRRLFLTAASAMCLFHVDGKAQIADQSVLLPAPPTPSWPASVSPARGAPNVVLILVDDAGFSATSTFGGEAHTPNLDKLAAHGLRYNSFAVNAICSPTRAALLSGRNNHQIGFGTVAERATPYPGYNSLWPKSAASIAEVLKENGYCTAAFGKWHNTPRWESGPTGPFDHWPTSLGVSLTAFVENKRLGQAMSLIKLSKTCGQFQGTNQQRNETYNA